MSLFSPPIRLGPTRILLLAILTLAVGLLWMWFDRNGHLRNMTWSSPQAVKPDIKMPTVPNLGQMEPSTSSSVILERPIFAPDRRPPPPPPPPTVPPPPDPLADLQIKGIFDGQTAGILAIVGGKSRRINLNDTIGPWSLKSVEGRDVTFTRGTETRKLHMAYARLNTPVPVAPKPPTANASTAAPAQNATNSQDAMRERLKRRNELRASRGLPPVAD